MPSCQTEGMKYKRFKTLVLNYIEEVPELDDVEWVYYMDIDMLMGAPFDQLVKNLDEEYGIEGTAVDDEDNHTTSTIYMFKDPNSVKFAMNSGFIGMSRKNSKHCLDLWREEMGEGLVLFLQQFCKQLFTLLTSFFVI